MPWVLHYSKFRVDTGEHYRGYIHMTWAVWRAQRKKGWV